jgi:hypothetical protein
MAHIKDTPDAWDRLYSDPEHDPIASLEWLANEADDHMSNPLTPAWGIVLRMAKTALEKSLVRRDES